MKWFASAPALEEGSQQLLQRVGDLERVVEGIIARIDALQTDLRQLREAHPLEEPVAELQGFAEGVDGRLKDMTLAIAEGIERVDRAERRVQQSIRRARKELEDVGYTSERLEAEAEGFPAGDGGGGAAAGVQPVPSGVAAPRRVPDWLPGEWSSADIQRLRG